MTTSRIPLIARAETGDLSRIAIRDERGVYTYRQLLDVSARVASNLLEAVAARADGECRDLEGARVAFIVHSSFEYVAVQWGIWRAGGIAVPLCTLHPPGELAYVIENADAALVLAGDDFMERLEPVCAGQKRKLASIRQAMEGNAAVPLPNVAADRGAMLVYTSGTTSRPKGALSTHATLAAQISSLIEAWEWTERDAILLFLPLHHLHGIVNVLCCALWAGATCEMMPQFDAGKVWARLLEGGLTLFMAVPTIYVRLVKAWRESTPEEQARMTAACRALRLMVSGSAALPVTTLREWEAISGHFLLERYGMTEIGMGLSNPLHGERKAGFVGAPLPGVEVRLVDENFCAVPDGEPGEIQVRGAAVFREYWRRPKATAEAFVDGWFRTGDVAVCERGSYRILGRNSVDIIKTGAYKVSALEIEEVLRNHPAIDQCAVVGVEDAEWGERVCAAVTLKEGEALDLPALRAWAKGELAVYKVPSRLHVMEELPRNAMGKVVKPDLVKIFKELEG